MLVEAKNASENWFRIACTMLRCTFDKFGPILIPLPARLVYFPFVQNLVYLLVEFSMSVISNVSYKQIIN